jgi:hypothetical protein
MTIITRIGLAAAVLAVLGLGALELADYEEPAYSVVSAHDGYELRLYEPFLVAETRVSGEFRPAGSEAFRRLAGYIFGDNAPGERMAMTAPVLSQPAEGEKMAMTVPVLSRRDPATADEPGWTYQFVMERRYTLDTLPRPNDGRVELREVPARWIAARRFSGRWTGERIAKQEQALLAGLAADGLAPLGAPELARYNGPMTPWFMRRNEILVEIAPPGR